MQLVCLQTGLPVKSNTKTDHPEKFFAATDLLERHSQAAIVRRDGTREQTETPMSTIRYRAGDPDQSSRAKTILFRVPRERVGHVARLGLVRSGSGWMAGGLLTVSTLRARSVVHLTSSGLGLVGRPEDCCARTKAHDAQIATLRISVSYAYLL